jgi:nitrogenase-associated protein
MSVVVFYEKPGCSGNARQKDLLEASGHTVVARNIMNTAWVPMQLLSFLKLLPIAQWFNRNAPMIKRGEIDPDAFDDAEAATVLSLLQANPLLLRRPLLEVDGVRRAGFDVVAIHDWIGLSAAFVGHESGGVADLETCRHVDDGAGLCSGHDGTCCHEPNPAVET